MKVGGTVPVGAAGVKVGGTVPVGAVAMVPEGAITAELGLPKSMAAVAWAISVTASFCFSFCSFRAEKEWDYVKV